MNRREDILESKDFYELLQIYHFTPVSEQDLVIGAVENIKTWLRKHAMGGKSND